MTRGLTTTTQVHFKQGRGTRKVIRPVFELRNSNFELRVVSRESGKPSPVRLRHGDRALRASRRGEVRAAPFSSPPGAAKRHVELLTESGRFPPPKGPTSRPPPGG